MKNKDRTRVGQKTVVSVRFLLPRRKNARDLTGRGSISIIRISNGPEWKKKRKKKRKKAPRSKPPWPAAEAPTTVEPRMPDAQAVEWARSESTHFFAPII